MGSIRKRAVAVVAAAALGAVALAGAPTAQSAPGFALTRVAGADRYATAAALATAAFPNGSDVAVVASGENFPDALAGSFLAGRFGAGAPILLTMRDSLPSATANALDTLDVETVYVLGGTGAVSEAVATALGADDRTVVRIAGTNRYATAAEVATFTATGAAAPGSVGGQKTIIVASGEGFADALASGPLAFKGKLPIVLTPAAALDDGARAAIEELDAQRAWIVGGTAAVSTAVENELKQMGLTVVRIAGANRYATAVEISKRGRADLGLSSSAIDLASGQNFPDALAAGPASGVANRSLLLTATAALSEETKAYLASLSATLSQGRVFGGTAAVSNAAVQQANAAGSTGATTGVNRVVGVDKANDEYQYVQDGTDEVVSVDYSANDDFTVDGQDASLSGFEGAITLGDIIEVDNPNAATEHELTNVAASSYTSGVVGNVDLADDQFDIVEPVSGAAFRSNITYSGTFRVDAAASTLADFEADINEGDTIEIAGGSFTLTNTNTTGEARDVVHPDPNNAINPSTRFKIGGLGDIPASGSDGGLDQEGRDSDYQANGGPGASGQSFVVGGANADYEAFDDALSEGDTVTYARRDGVETFTVTNATQDDVEGVAKSIVTDIDTTPELLGGEPADSDGGTATVLDDDGDEVEIDYTDGGQFLVDGLVSTEAAFESQYSAGDEVAITPGDDGNGTNQVVELTNAPAEGVADDVNETDSPVPDPEEDQSGARPAKSYDVLYEGTELVTVEYTQAEADGGPTEHEYFVNGDEVDVDCFEDALANGVDIVWDGGDDPDVAGTWEHRATVDDEPDCV